MVLSYPLNRRLMPFLLIGLALLLILSSCTSSSINKYQRENLNVKPTPILESAVPDCSLPPCTVSGDTPAIRNFIDTWNNIHIFQSFDYNITNPSAVAYHYDFVWGAATDHVSAIRSGNPKIFISYYIPFHRDSGTAVHPDWILYKCDRVTPAYEFGNPNIPLDFANPALVAWQIKTYGQPASENGYDGIAADNVGMENYYNACGVYINGTWVQRYTGQPDDPQWREDIVSWLTRMQQALHQLQHPLALIPNLSLGSVSPDDPLVQQALSHVDGVLDEDGFTNDARGYLTGNDWVQRIHLMRNVQEQHKPYYVVNQFQAPSISRDSLQWALASYLMGKGRMAALFISTYQGYGADTRYNEYNTQIGSPHDVMYQWQNVYWRDYTNGLILVNPSATEAYTVTFSAGSHYFDLYGYSVGKTVTLPAHSGMVLLSSI